jgi:hypothetical protein
MRAEEIGAVGVGGGDIVQTRGTASPVDPIAMF